MNHDAITRAQQIKRKHRVKSKLQKIAVVLACVVVFCTTYAMILPNMTNKVETYCHLQEHIHVRECGEVRDGLPSTARAALPVCIYAFYRLVMPIYHLVLYHIRQSIATKK